MDSPDPNKNTMADKMDCPSFKESLNSLRVQHAIVRCGQKILYFFMTSLLCGNIRDIKGCLRENLGSNNQFKNSFTKDEHKLLDEGEHHTWDVSLLFKILQKICGLEPCENQIWTTHTFGEESLEYLITRLKEMRNRAAHTFGEVIPQDEMEDRLTQLTDLALKMMTAFGARSQILGRQVSDTESSEIIMAVFSIVNDVKEKINEGHAGPVAELVQRTTTNDQKLQFDNVYVAAGGGGQTHQEPSLQEVYEDLARKFWLCAGLE